jgi:RNA polymerase sigma-70 factor (ECF subfamily)
MKRYIASRIRSITDAEDLVQNVFFELCKGNGRYDHRRNSNVEGYLFGMATNAIRRYHRERKKPVKIISINSANDIATIPNIHLRQNPARQVSTQELKRAIEDAVIQLPLKAREAIKLRFIDGLSTEQAGQKAGCTPGTFCERLSYAVKILRKAKGSIMPWNK